jgi:hypothetical protein
MDALGERDIGDKLRWQLTDGAFKLGDFRGAASAGDKRHSEKQCKEFGFHVA